MIDAEIRSEERFSRLALAYESEEEKKCVLECVDRFTSGNDLELETYTTKVSNGKEVLVLEYHDDMGRESGDIFEEIIKSLEIKVCH